MFSQSFLLASLIWGSVGVGYLIYGKKQAAIVPLIGGALLIGASYLIASWVIMSLVAFALIAGMQFLIRLGY